VALAGTAISIDPSIPTIGGAVTVGATGVASSLSITNNSTTPQNAGTIGITNATLTAVSGVFSLSATGTGAASTPGCSGSVWNITGGPATWTFTPTSAVNLTSTHASSATTTTDCQIDFAVDVLTRPTTEPTAYSASVAGTWSVDGTGTTGTGGSSTHINPATPVLSTTASGPVTVGSPIHDVAHLSGGVGTITGSILFPVVASSDTTCSTALTPALLSVPVSQTAPGSTDFTSPDFTTAVTGTYLWEATFTDTDGNSSISHTACGATGDGMS
jgi:hypothetical protein